MLEPHTLFIGGSDAISRQMCIGSIHGTKLLHLLLTVQCTSIFFSLKTYHFTVTIFSNEIDNLRGTRGQDSVISSLIMSKLT